MLHHTSRQLSAASDFNTPQYHEDFDANETLLVEQSNPAGGNSEAQERAHLAMARRMRNEGNKERLDTPQYHEDFDAKETPVVEQSNPVGGDSEAQERARLAKRVGNEGKKEWLDTPQYYGGFDAKETLVVAHSNPVGGNSEAQERARLAIRVRNEGKKERLDTPQYHEDFDTEETLVVEQQSVFSGNSAAKERAQLAKQRRDGVNRSKKDRKNTVLESLDFLGDSSSDFRVEGDLDEKKSRQSLSPLRSSSKPVSKSSMKSSSIDAPSLPSMPQAAPERRLPYHYREDKDNTHLNGKIVPSDQAFSDMILDEGQALPEGSAWADFILVESLTDRVSMDSLNTAFSYVYTHIMRYNGEVIWTMETRSNCDNQGTWGQSSTCNVRHREGLLRVNITHKGRRNLGQGWNTRERREHKLADLIRQSGEARQKEFMG